MTEYLTCKQSAEFLEVPIPALKRLQKAGIVQPIVGENRWAYFTLEMLEELQSKIKSGEIKIRNRLPRSMKILRTVEKKVTNITEKANFENYDLSWELRRSPDTTDKSGPYASLVLSGKNQTSLSLSFEEFDSLKKFITRVSG